MYCFTEGLAGDSGGFGVAGRLLAPETWGWLEVTELSVGLILAISIISGAFEICAIFMTLFSGVTLVVWSGEESEVGGIIGGRA